MSLELTYGRSGPVAAASHRHCVLVVAPIHVSLREALRTVLHSVPSLHGNNRSGAINDWDRDPPNLKESIEKWANRPLTTYDRAAVIWASAREVCPRPRPSAPPARRSVYLREVTSSTFRGRYTHTQKPSHGAGLLTMNAVYPIKKYGLLGVSQYLAELEVEDQNPCDYMYGG